MKYIKLYQKLKKYYPEEMFINFIVNKKLKDKDINDNKVRREIGEFCGWVGLILNLFISISKLVIGVLISSISIMADGVNNAFDTASSIATIVGYKLAGKPADEEHPYGHGRIEYVTGVVISIFVIFIGAQFIKASYERIINPQIVAFDKVSLAILIISIILKLWISRFNKVMGKRIQSKTLLAIAYDSMGDVITTIVVIVPMISGIYFDFQIDGYIGIAVSIMIIYNGINLLKSTISPLIGNPPDNDVYKSIVEIISKHEYIYNIHNLRYENYGVGDSFMVIDVEMPADFTLEKAHHIVDVLEREVFEKLGIHLVIHMEPLKILKLQESKVLDSIKNNISDLDWICDIKDFRVESLNNEKIGYIDFFVDGNRVNINDEKIFDLLTQRLNKLDDIKWKIRVFREFFI